MVLKKGDFIRINFIGRIKETGEVFDTTQEDVAKKHNLYDSNINFKAQPIIVGARHVLPGVDKGLLGAEVGEKKIIEVAPEEGYGNRDPSKVQLIPLKEFKKKGINPVPGMHLEVGDGIGRVQSVGGGRVRVDLNHGLAGKVLEFEVNVEERTNKKEEKIRQLLELHFPYADPHDHKITARDGGIEIVLSDGVKLNPAAGQGKFANVRDIFAFVEGVEQVTYKEIYDKHPAEEKKEKKPKKKSQSKKAKGSKTSST